MTDAPLKQLGKYELTGVLGEGAMGVVYRAFDPVLNRYLAIKVMNAAIATDASLRERFLREARSAGSLQHPNVITIFDFGESDGHLFIAMEFIEGVDLAEVMEHPESVPMLMRLEIIIDALNGLAYAHARGLVHRDIKPANIRITTDNHAKIMDFGIARVESSELTQAGVMIGTPQYMAPEQVMGGAITPATDVFSMGTVLYEFLSNIKPFHGETLHAVLFNVVSENPRPVREIVRGLPPMIDVVLTKALAKDPAARYENALAMAKDLAAARLAMTGAGEVATIAIAARTAEFRSHTATAVRDPHLQSFIKREGAQEPVKAPSRVPWIVAGAMAGLAALVVIWMALRNPVATSAATSAGPAAAPAPISGAPQPNVAANPVIPTPRNPAAPAPPDVGRSGRSPAPHPTLPANTAQADSALRSMRAAAVVARRSAQDAGAGPADLAPGDSLMGAADALMGRGRSTEAAVQLSMASARWGDAQRAAERAAERAAARAAERAAAPPERQRAATPPAPVVTAPPTATQPEAPSKPPTDPRPEIERVISAYARAIESGDVGEIRRAYPGLTPAQQQGWDGFFRSVRNFKATLAVDQLAVTGSSANAGIGAVYEYDNRTTGRADRQQLRLQATLNRESGGWRLSSIR